jgi:hypothetical protein
MSTTLLLGNVAPLQQVTDEDGATATQTRRDLGEQVTTVHYPSGADQPEASDLARTTRNDRVLNRIDRNVESAGYLLALRDLEDLWWNAHSEDPPEWVASDDPNYAEIVAAYFRAEAEADVEIRSFEDFS